MSISLLNRPFIKSKHFNPAPVAKYGIPIYADSILNKKVVGTEAWRSWWEEQLYYIINGYETAGVFIPGRYYYYLNFFKTSSVKGGGSFYPMYIDFQYEYFLLVEEAKRCGKNIVMAKGRRKGASSMEVAIADYGWRFIPDYKVGVVAGKKEYTEDFVDKWIYLDSLIVPEFRTRKLSKTYDEVVAGWSEKDDVGSWSTYGTQNKFYFRTAFSDPEIFKGKFLNDAIFEEVGEFDNLIKTIQATEACLKDGNIQYGTAYYYGTGGNIATGSRGYEELWHDADKYNCLRYFIDGPKFFSPCFAGATGKEGKLIEDIPNLSIYKKHERVGMEDEVRAKEIIEEHKQFLLKGNRDLKKYFEYCKDNPVDIKEVFRKTASNNFPVDILNDQNYRIKSEDKRWSKFVLSYVLDEKGIIKFPHEVVAKPASNDVEETECVWILNSGHPQQGMRNLDVAGIDSYDQDLALSSNSLGAMVVLRQDHNLPDIDRMTPVCMIRCRPKRREKFYEMCLMTSIYYDLKYNTLVDVGKPAIIEYYKQKGCAMYLAKRPVKFESESSQQTHEYGMAITSHSKPLMMGLLQSYFYDYAERIWFDVLIDEALSYDEGSRYSESDKDAVDALGIALIQLNAQSHGVVNDRDLNKINPYAFPEYEEDMYGNMIPVKKVDVSRYQLPNNKLTDDQLWERKIELDFLRENLREDDGDED